ncbi:MAG TPA: hypothetical protein VHB79_32705 [Polyangiaceae bacterium]|nr:hypothetical protein [Polyangiaceae bacterium]
MTPVGRALSFGAALLVAACGGSARKAEPLTELPAPAKSTPRQAGYCDRLQPLLTQAVTSARIGTQMACLDIPGVTELGRFGTPGAGEEGVLSDCFDEPGEYEKLLDRTESDFDLNIDQGFSSEVGGGGGVSLGALVPWMPSLSLDLTQTRHVTARVAVKHARFVTLLGLASRLQGQRREQQCLEALCKPEYQYVHKALVGVPSLVVSAENGNGTQVALGVPLLSGHYNSRELEHGSREITASEPVTLAVARSAFRTPSTERLCQFCGRNQQTCCVAGPACDGGLGCIDERCVEVGGPDQPCDGERCASGACVGGRCRTACGGANQPCCANSVCSGALRCSPDPESDIEPQLSSEEVAVGGGLLGTSEDRTFGSSSCGPLRTRGRFAVTKLGSGRGQCEKAWWFDPKNEKDCRVAVHFDVSMLGTISCKVEVFGAPVSKPKRCGL